MIAIATPVALFDFGKRIAKRQRYLSDRIGSDRIKDRKKGRVVEENRHTIALSIMMAVSMYLVASRTSLLYRSEVVSDSPRTCFCRRFFVRHSRFPELAQPLLAFVRASNIT